MFQNVRNAKAFYLLLYILLYRLFLSSAHCSSQHQTLHISFTCKKLLSEHTPSIVSAPAPTSLFVNALTPSPINSIPFNPHDKHVLCSSPTGDNTIAFSSPRASHHAHACPEILRPDLPK
ncbi:hypothetical protein Zmor_012573 [Zophobas morio]|uniref:Uncharacterized protein n=1 Tax=Zophobas morio TaxID=2755281 RepID=A0AA38MDV0_9CUCU|nr:hypothetical protein Zmor_012573 [Zophobas morio]